MSYFILEMILKHRNTGNFFFDKACFDKNFGHILYLTLLVEFFNIFLTSYPILKSHLIIILLLSLRLC
jgi:hypothetical protein